MRSTILQRKALRTILLTGTPALSRPSELYSQLRIIDSKLFPNFRDFAIRYCDGKQGRFSFEAKGCTRSEELAIILQNNIMLRYIFGFLCLAILLYLVIFLSNLYSSLFDEKGGSSNYCVRIDYSLVL